jgi:hypothetical protein
MSDDLMDRRGKAAAKLQELYPVDPTSLAQAIVKAQVEAARVSSSPALADLPQYVRCKVRVKDDNGQTKRRVFLKDRNGMPILSDDGRPASQWEDVVITFSADELKHPEDAGKAYKFGDPVYLTREAYARFAGAGIVVIGQ